MCINSRGIVMAAFVRITNNFQSYNANVVTFQQGTAYGLNCQNVAFIILYDAFITINTVISGPAHGCVNGACVETTEVGSPEFCFNQIPWDFSGN